jgi:hypothetical protein
MARRPSLTVVALHAPHHQLLLDRCCPEEPVELGASKAKIGPSEDRFRRVCSPIAGLSGKKTVENGLLRPICSRRFPSPTGSWIGRKGMTALAASPPPDKPASSVPRPQKIAHSDTLVCTPMLCRWQHKGVSTGESAACRRTFPRCLGYASLFTAALRARTIP